MENLTRRKLLQAGAAGTLAAGLGTVTKVAGAGADPVKLGGIHVHGSLEQTAGPGGGIGRLIDLNVFGPDDDLSGSGWDANPEKVGASQPGKPDRTQCYWSQRGSVQGHTVHLVGRNLLWQAPFDDGAPVIVEADLATGHIKWTTVPGPTFVFEGTGVVGRI